MEAHLLCLVSDLCNIYRQAMQLTKYGISQWAANGLANGRQMSGKWAENERPMGGQWAENERQMRGKWASNRW